MLDRSAKRAVDTHSSLAEPARVEVSELSGAKLGELPVLLDKDFASLGSSARGRHTDRSNPRARIVLRQVAILNS